jgi:hypothetical protein
MTPEKFDTLIKKLDDPGEDVTIDKEIFKELLAHTESDMCLAETFKQGRSILKESGSRLEKRSRYLKVLVWVALAALVIEIVWLIGMML